MSHSSINRPFSGPPMDSTRDIKLITILALFPLWGMRTSWRSRRRSAGEDGQTTAFLAVGGEYRLLGVLVGGRRGIQTSWRSRRRSAGNTDFLAFSSAESFLDQNSGIVIPFFDSPTCLSQVSSIKKRKIPPPWEKKSGRGQRNENSGLGRTTT